MIARLRERSALLWRGHSIAMVAITMALVLSACGDKGASPPCSCPPTQSLVDPSGVVPQWIGLDFESDDVGGRLAFTKTYTIAYDVNGEAAQGIITKESPAPGTTLTPGQTVRVTVSDPDRVYTECGKVGAILSPSVARDKGSADTISVRLLNRSSSATCRFQHLAVTLLAEGDETYTVSSSVSTTTPVILRPGGKRTLDLRWGNWCGPAKRLVYVEFFLGPIDVANGGIGAEQHPGCSGAGSDPLLHWE